MTRLRLENRSHCWVGHFRAMASPCEIHIELDSRQTCLKLMRLAMDEALRIEHAFSRYRDDNIIWSINNSAGKPVVVDDEMARMLDFADHCHGISEGLFDITSGVLRELWHFDGSGNVPDERAVAALLPRIGWQKVNWSRPEFLLPEGMQIDLGGIGKEYAVDRSLTLLRQHTDAAVLVNYGGDLHASGPPQATGAWQVGVDAASTDGISTISIQLHRGALTTSGDAHRYLLRGEKRYSHVLNPQTGWPVSDAPGSVTVAGNSCVEAGVLSTLAMLKGTQAEIFLQQQGVSHWVQRNP